jgi:hypothetical protein
MAFCSYCGHSLEPEAAYCPACGHQVVGGPAGTTTPPPYPGSPGYYGYPAPAYGEADKKALGRLWFACLIFLGTFVIGYGSLIVLNPFALFTHMTPSSSGTVPNFPFTGVFLSDLIVLSIVSVGVELLAIILVYSSFRNLQSVDRPHFRTPTILTFLYLIVLPVFFIGIGIELAGIPGILSSFSQHSTTPPTFTGSGLGIFFAGSIIEFFSALIALAGFIGGIMLGLWRAGDRYASTLMKVSAVLVIIPGLDLAVPVLLLIGIWRTRSRIFPAMPPASPV